LLAERWFAAGRRSEHRPAGQGGTAATWRTVELRPVKAAD